MSDSFLEDAVANHQTMGGTPEIANHVDVHDNAFVAAVLDPETKVKLVVEHHLDDDVDAGVQVVATCPGQDDVAIDLPVGDVAAFATLLITSMREAAGHAEAVAGADYEVTLLATLRERDALAELVLKRQNRKDGEPRPDASAAVDALNGQTLGEACVQLAAVAAPKGA